MVAFMTWSALFMLTKAEKEERAKAEEAQKAEYETSEDARVAKYPAGANFDCGDAIFGGLKDMKKRWYKEYEYYAVHLLVTDPIYQKKGLGTLLLKEAFDRADTEGKRAYLEAMEAGHNLYLRLGWADVDLLEVDVGKWGGEGKAPYWVMVREPQRTG
ncbi:hypothetical protein B7463_g7994, partial [Scytalidium lignicola]